MIKEISSFVLNSGPGALVGAVVSLTVGILIGRASSLRQQRRMHEALLKKDIGYQFSNVTYATYQWRTDNTKGKKCTQRLRPFDGKFNLAEVFNGKTQERYLEYIAKAAALAKKTEKNPYVFDYLEQAIKECNEGLPYKIHRMATNVFSNSGSLDPKEIHKDMMRDIKIALSKEIQRNAEAYPRLFDGVDFDEANGTRFYPMLVAEKEAQHTQIKILLLREYDLLEGNIPDQSQDVLVHTGRRQYECKPDHPHMLRWRTNRLMIDRLNSDEGFANKIAIQIGLPSNLQMATQEQRNKTGILPPPSL